MTATVLVVEDDRALVRLFEYNLRKWGYEVITANRGDEFRNLYSAHPVELILLDIQLPDADGIDLLAEAKHRDPDISVVIMTAHGTIERAVDAMKAGAYDFLTKPIDWASLEITVKNAIERYRLTQQVTTLRETLGRRTRFQRIVGVSKKMQTLYSLIENVAVSNVSVLITGESGTGKELVAQAIHAVSPRRDTPIVDVNCAAIPSQLMESEIFGHEKGAFTGAGQRHIGCCERADKSTLFLDEICEMDISLQAKLLRFLQERYFQRIGGKNKIYVDTRIVSATNRNPLDEIREGRFREDLFYRLNVVNVQIPPLRERGEDIPLLAQHFLQRTNRESGKNFESISENAQDVLCRYAWPGNVRELQNVIAQAVALHNGKLIEVDMLPDHVRESTAEFEEQTSVFMPATAEAQNRELESPATDVGSEAIKVDEKDSESVDQLLPLSTVERVTIEKALRICSGNIPEVSHHLGISQATLYRKVKEFGLTISNYKEKKQHFSTE